MPDIQTKYLRLANYVDTYEAMRSFTEARDERTPDELWLCEHKPVFTLGLAGKREHLLNAHELPVIETNRGGQVTYHGPGQVVAYPLIDLKRCDGGRGIYVKEYVFRLEQAVIQTLDHFGVMGQRVKGAPGIYVALPAETSAVHAPFQGLAKIAALGIKITRHYAYHGVALNVAMDLKPFTWINPCGYEGLATVDLATLGINVSWDEAAAVLSERLQAHLA